MKPNPFGVETLGTIKLGNPGEDEKDYISRLISMGLEADDDRSDWIERQKNLTKLRYGLRKQKNFPWPGASNLNIPLIDHAIRKYKPGLLRLFTEPTPLVEFQGIDPDSMEAERTAEQTFDWVFKVLMDAIEPMAYMLDQMCARGYSFIQVGWDYQSEYVTRVVQIEKLLNSQIIQQAQQSGTAIPAQFVAQRLINEYQLDPTDPRIIKAVESATAEILRGARAVTLTFKEVIQDRPAIWERDPVQMILPQRCTSPQNAEWAVVQHLFPIRKLKQLEADGYFINGSIAKVLNSITIENEIKKGNLPSGYNELDAGFSQSLKREQDLQAEREKIWGQENDDNVLVWQIYHWFDYNNDGLAERVETWIHPRSRTKLKCCRYAGPFSKWPLIQFRFETTNRRLNSSRGIPQMLMDLQIETNAQHNGRIDGMTLRNAPAWQINVLSGFRARNFRVVPGTVIQTPAGATLQPLVQDRGAFPEQLNEENLLRAIAENYIGIYDAAITSPMSQQKARTATEITAIIQYTSSTSTMDATLFQVACKELYSMIWELWLDLGPDEFFIPKDDPNVKFIKVTKAEISKKFKLNPTGTILNTNRALETANAREAATLYLNDVTGIIDEQALRQWHLGCLAPPRWVRKIIRPPEAAAYVQQLKAAAAAYQNQPEIAAAMRGSVQTEQPEMPTTEVASSSQYGGQGSMYR